MVRPSALQTEVRIYIVKLLEWGIHTGLPVPVMLALLSYRSSNLPIKERYKIGKTQKS